MNKKLVLGIVLIPIMLYLAISSSIRLMDAQENVRIAEHEVEIAKQEYAAANQEIDDLLATAASNQENIAIARQNLLDAQARMIEEQSE
jgi:hypothetical protein